MKRRLSIKKIIIFCFSIILIFIFILLYSRYIGTKTININEYNIKYKNLSNDFYGLKIVHISDIHFGKTTDEEDLEELVDKINLTKPDILIFTGDLIDKENNFDTSKISSILSNIKVTIGKYACLGEDDKKYSSFIEESGFKILNNSYDFIYTNSTNYILIAGIDTDNMDLTSINEYISSDNNKANYSILLMHKPDKIKELDVNYFNLILAGHSHNGQIRLPFIGALIKKDGSKIYTDSYYKIQNTDFYITGGIGTSDMSFRLFNHPSFNLYRLTN